MSDPRSSRQALDPLPCGIYETLLDEELAGLLENRPDLIATLVAIDDESAPQTYGMPPERLYVISDFLPSSGPRHPNSAAVRSAR